jgi:hypothetical protein
LALGCHLESAIACKEATGKNAMYDSAIRGVDNMASVFLNSHRAYALRGDLRISVPIGYIWHWEIGLGLDPSLRVQEAVRVVFMRFRQLGSARQALLSLATEQMHFPRPSDGKTLVSFDWTPIRYRNIISILKNPFYAGAYVYGKSEKRTALVEGRVRTTYDVQASQAF